MQKNMAWGLEQGGSLGEQSARKREGRGKPGMGCREYERRGKRRGPKGKEMNGGLGAL